MVEPPDLMTDAHGSILDFITTALMSYEQNDPYGRDEVTDV
jgi:hypothetical protein